MTSCGVATSLIWDRCERLCLGVGDAVESCRSESLDWEDLGAASGDDFVDQCRGDWNELSTELTAREQELALDVCEEASVELEELSCEEVMALYAP